MAKRTEKKRKKENPVSQDFRKTKPEHVPVEKKVWTVYMQRKDGGEVFICSAFTEEYAWSLFNSWKKYNQKISDSFNWDIPPRISVKTYYQ